MLSAWASRANGGVFEAVVAQVDVLRRLGAVPVVFAIDDEHHTSDRWRFGDCEIHALPGSGPHQIAYARGLGAALDAAQLDLLHLHGIWQMTSHAAGAWARRNRKPLIISPHGMMAPWITQSRAWKKHLARALWERRSWRSATAFHALTRSEAEDIAREIPGAQIATVPNAAPEAFGPRDTLPPPHALYLGRIHPKKNIDAFINAWECALPDLPAGATLTIAGWGDDAGIEALEARLRHNPPGIQFVGAAFGSQKAALFDISRFCVLPSLSEGLPMVILEAWAAGVPTIMSEACHLPEGYSAGAALACGTDVKSLRRSLIAGFSMQDTEWIAMSRAAQALATGPFSIATIAARWKAFYERLLVSDAAV